MEDYHRHLERLQLQIETDFHEKMAALDRQRAKLEAEHKTAIDTLAQLRRALGSNGSQSDDVFPYRHAKTLTEAVNHVIHEYIAGDFDINTVIAFVIRHHPEIKQPINPTSVSGILRTHRESGVLETIREGAGPKPAVYRLTEFGRKEFDIVEEVRRGL